MITLKIKNFRSIANAEIELSPITVFYGPNGSGKSSILYSLLVLRNVLMNPNQSVDNFFNLSFTNLGGFEQVIFDHIKDEKIQLEIDYQTEDGSVKYGVDIGRKSGNFYIYTPKLMKNRVSLPVTFPYPANARETIKIQKNSSAVELIWNGITVQLPSEVPPDIVDFANEATKLLNSVPELFRKVDIIPLKRGFTKPSYSPVNLTSHILQEDEVATLLANERYLEGKVQSYCRDIFDKTFQVRAQIGTALFYLQVTDKKGFTSELVNEGFGLNQTIFLLTKILRSDVSLICIEEPEIHLHPSAQSKLVRALVQSVGEENKIIVLSTHSEHIVSGLLSAVARGEIRPEEISCHLCTKPKKKTEIKKQPINSKGQIVGGLSSFMEAELENLKYILKVKG